MNVLQKLISIATIFGFVAFSSCDRCEEYYFAYGNDLSFTVLNRNTLENILHVRNMNFNYDTVKVFHENWEVAFDSPVPLNGIISLRFLDPIADRDVLDQLISKRFYMYFNFQDIDTIDIDFKMKKDDCGQVMSYFKVAYNDSTYFDNTVNNIPSFDFLKL